MPNFNNQIDYDILARVSNDSQKKNNYSSVLGDIKQLEETTPFNINQNISYYYTLNEKNIFAFEAQNLVKNEDPFYNVILKNDPTGIDSFDTTAKALGLDPSFSNYNFYLMN
jgi:hypothetical protein